MDRFTHTLEPGTEPDSVFTMEAVRLKFGCGVSREVGQDVAALGVTRVMLLTDGHIRDSQMVATVLESIRSAGIDVAVFDGVHCEPTDRSWQAAFEFAAQGRFDGFVAVGGGSTIDTAKATNLYSTYPAPLRRYINPPLGEGAAPPGQLKPLVAIPTTAGTGSESTGVAIVDLLDEHVKTGISHRRLRPSLGLVDPLNTLTLPAAVTASTGADVLTHALESFTARPYTSRPRPERSSQRPAYVGANPISDIWSRRAISLVSRYLPRAVRDGSDLEAREQMMLAATMAGVGFANAGVHVAHAMGYPLAGQARQWVAPGYPPDQVGVPHGWSTIVGSPAAARFTAPADPARHLEAARLMGAATDRVDPDEAGNVLAEAIVRFMRQIDAPNGIGQLGFGPQDIDSLAAGAWKQQRLLAVSPRPISQRQLAEIFRQALRYW